MTLQNSMEKLRLTEKKSLALPSVLQIIRVSPPKKFVLDCELKLPFIFATMEDRQASASAGQSHWQHYTAVEKNGL